MVIFLGDFRAILWSNGVFQPDFEPRITVGSADLEPKIDFTIYGNFIPRKVASQCGFFDPPKNSPKIWGILSLKSKITVCGKKFPYAVKNSHIW